MFDRHSAYGCLMMTMMIMIAVSGCTNVIRASEEMYMRPGALDPGIPNDETVYDEYNLRFMNDYYIRHQWLGIGDCGYGSVSTATTRFVDGNKVEIRYTGSVYQDQTRILTDSLSPDVKPLDITDYFRSHRLVVPTRYETRNGKEVVAEQKEKEFGYLGMCGKVWTGINMSVVMFFHERSIPEWEALIRSEGEYKHLKPTKTIQKIGGNVWTIFTLPIQPRKINTYAGSYKFYITEVGDSGFTIAWELGANEESLKHSGAFEAMEQMFMRLIRSTKIEPWNEEAAREMELLKRKAMELTRQDCIKKYQNRPTRAPVWCKQYLQ